MSATVTYQWTAADNAALAAIQSSGGAGSMILNGTLSTNVKTVVGAIDLERNYRNVSLTSTQNNAAVNFTINGYFEKNPVSFTIAGPNNSTVETSAVQLLTSVTSITSSGAINAVSAGTGHLGNISWFHCNNLATVMALCLTTAVTGTINYTFEATLDDIDTAPTLNVFNPVPGMIAATTNLNGFVTQPFRFGAININSSTGAATLTARFLQQGIV
jgi:hypothetical protein